MKVLFMNVIYTKEGHQTYNFTNIRYADLEENIPLSYTAKRKVPKKYKEKKVLATAKPRYRPGFRSRSNP